MVVPVGSFTLKPDAGRSRFFLIATLIVAAGLLLCASAKADQVVWISDSPTGINAQVSGTVLIGAQMDVSYASPSGLWNASYSFSVGSNGYDSRGNAVYLLNSFGAEEIYWNGNYFFEAGWAQGSGLPVAGGEGLDGSSFTGGPGSLWSANSRISISADPQDSTRLDYTITFLASGPALPDMSDLIFLTSAGVQPSVPTPVIPTPSSQIVEFSGRALSGSGDDTLILGFAVTGDGMNLLARGVGPSLAQFGIANFLPDPALALFGADGDVVGANNNWSIDANGNSQAAPIAVLSAAVGAFPLLAGSEDSALAVTLNQGSYTTGLVAGGSAGGVALTEIYNTGSPVGTRLIDLSVRGNVAAGDGIIIAGFVIAGNAPKTVLIRGVGPTLASYGVTGALADPVITVFSAGSAIATNHNWETGSTTPAQMIGTFAQVGAFPLQAGSSDSATVLTLQPGAYSVQLASVGGTTGVGLIEVYEVQ